MSMVDWTCESVSSTERSGNGRVCRLICGSYSFVNNAGIAIELADPRPIWAADEDVFDLTQRVNTRGVFLGCKYASAQMRTQEPHQNGDRGWIINIGSVLGLVGTECSASISASKGAVTALTRAAALDCAPHRVG